MSRAGRCRSRARRQTFVSGMGVGCVQRDSAVKMMRTHVTKRNAAMPQKIKPTRVRYIKLGEGGGWEHECINKGIIRFGFGSATAERFLLCRAGRWDALTKSFMAEGRNKGTATRFTNETRLFFED